MTFLIGLLTVVLVLNCVLLILLVLIQLPKKEAGAGLAFGGAATDALFGAGAGGNVLTKITKYATVTFFVLAMVLSVMQSKRYHDPANQFKRSVQQQSAQPPTSQPVTTPAPGESPAAAPPAATPALLTTNLQAAPK